MTITTERTTTLPSPVEVGFSRALYELKLFFREKEQVVFTFSLPVVLFLLFCSIFEGMLAPGVTLAQVYTAAMIGSAILSASLQNLGTTIAVERDQGTLKRLAGTPMAKSSYFLGKILSVLVIALVEVAILLALAVVLYDVPLPSDWLTFSWVFVLGLTAGCLLGIAASNIAKSAKSANAVITLPFMVLQFASGVFIPFSKLPEWLVTLASFFPLRWMCQGFRSVFLGEGGASLEIAGSYELDRVAMILGAWCIGGLLLCLKTFRWKSRRDG